MTVPFWVEANVKESFWDILFLGGDLWPGICKIDASQKRDIDTAKEAGRDPTLTDKGFDPGEVNATIMVWEEEQLRTLEQLLQKYSPKKSDALRSPLDIWHPSTVMLGIYSVVIREVKITHPNEKILVVDMPLLQWFPSSVSDSMGPAKQATSDALREEDFQVGTPDAEAAL